LSVLFSCAIFSGVASRVPSSDVSTLPSRLPFALLGLRVHGDGRGVQLQSEQVEVESRHRQAEDLAVGGLHRRHGRRRDPAQATFTSPSRSLSFWLSVSMFNA